MKRIGILNIVLTIGLIVLFASCLKSDLDANIAPTAADEQYRLASYLNTLTQQGYDIDTTELGVYYITLEAGEGLFPKTGDTLELGYAGYFIDGVLFDASDLREEGGTFNFILGNPPMIKGWEDGMKVINKNAKVQLIIPSNLAYGSEGSGDIPAFATLNFVVKMIEIKPL